MFLANVPAYFLVLFCFLSYKNVYAKFVCKSIWCINETLYGALYCMCVFVVFVEIGREEQKLTRH